MLPMMPRGSPDNGAARAMRDGQTAAPLVTVVAVDIRDVRRCVPPALLVPSEAAFTHDGLDNGETLT